MNNLKQMVHQGRIVLGGFQSILYPDVTEIFGEAGWDFVIFDMEHTSFTGDAVRSCILAAERTSIAPIVRVAENQQWMIEQALDAGAQAVLVPWVETKEETQRAIKFSKFPPLGTRGWNPSTRAGRYGRLARDYAHRSNTETFVIAEIETPVAFDNLQEILSVEGLEAIFFGPGDLAVNMGFSGGEHDSSVQQKIDWGLNTAATKGVATFTVAFSPKAAKGLTERGAKAICFVSDIQLLRTQFARRHSEVMEALQGTSESSHTSPF